MNTPRKCLRCGTPHTLRTRPGFCSKFCADAWEEEHGWQHLWEWVDAQTTWKKINSQYHGKSEV